MARNSVISGVVSPEDYQMLKKVLGEEHTVSKFLNHMVQIVLHLDIEDIDAFMEAQPFILATAISGVLPDKDDVSCVLPF